MEYEQGKVHRMKEGESVDGFLRGLFVSYTVDLPYACTLLYN